MKEWRVAVRLFGQLEDRLMAECRFVSNETTGTGFGGLGTEVIVSLPKDTPLSGSHWESGIILDDFGAMPRLHLGEFACPLAPSEVYTSPQEVKRYRAAMQKLLAARGQ